MKKSKAKSKSGHGGARAGAGRPRGWKHRPLKMVRLPVAYAEKILEIAQYMNQNDGRLPFSEADEASIPHSADVIHLTGIFEKSKPSNFF
jgi:hypothetical protein